MKDYKYSGILGIGVKLDWNKIDCMKLVKEVLTINPYINDLRARNLYNSKKDLDESFDIRGLFYNLIDKYGNASIIYMSSLSGDYIYYNTSKSLDKISETFKVIINDMIFILLRKIYKDEIEDKEIHDEIGIITTNDYEKEND